MGAAQARRVTGLSPIPLGPGLFWAQGALSGDARLQLVDQSPQGTRPRHPPVGSSGTSIPLERRKRRPGAGACGRRLGVEMEPI